MIVLKVDMMVKRGTEEKCREHIRIPQGALAQRAGLVLYIGHQMTDNPRKFVFYEQYKDEVTILVFIESRSL
jgi:quinol monooxygenase YgiN